MKKSRSSIVHVTQSVNPRISQTAWHPMILIAWHFLFQDDTRVVQPGAKLGDAG